MQAARTIRTARYLKYLQSVTVTGMQPNRKPTSLCGVILQCAVTDEWLHRYGSPGVWRWWNDPMPLSLLGLIMDVFDICPSAETECSVLMHLH